MINWLKNKIYPILGYHRVEFKVNGKVLDHDWLKKQDNEDLEAIAWKNDKVKQRIDNLRIVKVVVIPNKSVNLVSRG